MSAYDKTSIQINRCKRILALVDTYVDCPTQDYRTALRKALMEEFEAPAIAPPVAAGSVDTEEFPYANHGLIIHEIGRYEGDFSSEEVNGIPHVKFIELCKLAVRTATDRAEKAEAELKVVKSNHAAVVERNRGLKKFADETQAAFAALMREHKALQASQKFTGEK